MVSLKRVQQLLNTLIEQLLSQATLLGVSAELKL
jgi:hypothetical protein